MDPLSGCDIRLVFTRYTAVGKMRTPLKLLSSHDNSLSHIFLYDMLAWKPSFAFKTKNV